MIHWCFAIVCHLALVPWDLARRFSMNLSTTVQRKPQRSLTSAPLGQIRIPKSEMDGSAIRIPKWRVQRTPSTLTGIGAVCARKRHRWRRASVINYGRAGGNNFRFLEVNLRITAQICARKRVTCARQDHCRPRFAARANFRPLLRNARMGGIPTGQVASRQDDGHG